MIHASRRAFLRSAVMTGAAGAAYRMSGSGLPPVSASEIMAGRGRVLLQDDIEPLVTLLEQTPRDRLVEEAAAAVRRGATYDRMLAALLLAGVRNVQPRPSVGFKFHAVLVVQSLHLASQASPTNDRWLPLFWGLDYFKHAQAQDQQEGDWTMAAVDEAAVPPADRAQKAFAAAMDDWNEDAADAAVAGLARHLRRDDVFPMLFQYGARDFRSIGHKAIFAANAHRALGIIGWQHAEPVLRSLAYAMLQHEGENPVRREASADMPGRRNHQSIAHFPADWQNGKPDPGATAQLLSVLHAGSEDEAAAQVVEMIGRGVAPSSIWDALFAAAAELVLRQPGIVALHAVTTTNALHYAWRHTRDEPTRRYALLQNASFLPMFREAMGGRGRLDDRTIGGLEPVAADANVEGVLEEISRDRRLAPGKALAYFDAGGQPNDLIAAARRVLLEKGDGSHDYKYTGAVFEDVGHISPAWRTRVLAASMPLLRGSADRDNPLVERVRAAFASR